jgi:hypothetical protein
VLPKKKKKSQNEKNSCRDTNASRSATLVFYTSGSERGSKRS